MKYEIKKDKYREMLDEINYIGQKYAFGAENISSKTERYSIERRIGGATLEDRIGRENLGNFDISDEKTDYFKWGMN